jgi:glycosyltransferase involved in cell wall biosynthesis
MPRKIALLLESDGPGGAETMLLTLAEALRDHGVDVFPVVFANGEGWLTGRLAQRGFEVYRPEIRRAIDVQLARQLARWSTHNGIQLLHAHEFTMGFYAGVAGFLSGTPHVLTMHGGTKFANVWRRRFALRLSARSAAAVVGVSESTCDHLASQLRLNRDTMEVIPNGIRVQKGEREATRARLGVGPQERLLLAVGNLYAVKGHSVLVEAAAQLKAHGQLPAWRVAIAGRGDQHDVLTAQIHRAGLDGSVTLLGLRDDIHDLLAAADGWIMPSHSEGLPMALLEAVLASVPVVCSAVGGIPDVIEHGSSGWLVPPNDSAALARAVTELLVNHGEGETRARLAYQQVAASYSSDVMAQRYLSVYRRALHV